MHIITELVITFKSNWRNAVEKLSNEFMNHVFYFKGVFQNIQSLLNKSDKYHSE